MVCCIASLTLSSFVTSVSMKVASPPALRTSCSLARPSSGLSSAITTLAPSCANSRAAARAIPEPAPVIKATLSCNCPMIGPSFRHYLAVCDHPGSLPCCARLQGLAWLVAVISRRSAPRWCGVVLSGVFLLPSFFPVGCSVNSQARLETALGRFQVPEEPRPRVGNGDTQKQQDSAEDPFGAEAVRVQLVMHPELDRSGEIDHQLARQLVCRHCRREQPGAFNVRECPLPSSQVILHKLRPIDVVLYLPQGQKQRAEEVGMSGEVRGDNPGRLEQALERVRIRGR